MERVISGNWGNQIFLGQKTARTGRSFQAIKARKKAGSAGSVQIKSSLQTGIFLLAAALIILGAVYLYQVNTIATKGYEIRGIENRIQDLQKENQKLQIREVELKSMYNIEKSMDNLNLVSSPNVSYIEVNGPMAMK